ncbi:nucleotidyltransferase [Staphylococcus caprae]|uniref:nucleotidyltransferase n=1 Tax=Staphylococcus caprae TaxID=29380 RepID=UPI003B20EEFB
MKSVGLITEYNPFHNGHLYHAQQSKQRSNSNVTIALMSGNFVMRGEPAIYNKFTRAEMALTGVDLVVELPLIASLSSGDTFAEMAVKVAQYLDIDTISFGSESADLNDLQQLADQISTLESHPDFKSKLKEGKSYPRILSELTDSHELLQSPNNLLGMSYLKAINQFAPQIEAMTIKREGSHHHHSEITHHQFASGTSIRQSLLQGNHHWRNVVPQVAHNLYKAPHVSAEDTFPFIKYQLTVQHQEDLKSIYNINEGFENRLKSMIQQSHSFKAFMQNLKTKRYTYTHIQRILMTILLNIKSQDVHKDIHAVRILGMNDIGRNYLKHLKNKFPEHQYITNINQKNAHYFQNEIKATHVYNLMSHQTQTDFNTPIIRK